jgi:hypothetical protein
VGKTLLEEQGKKDVIRLKSGWDCQVCKGFSCHKCATMDMFYTTIMTTFSYILTCSGTVHGRYKSIHHQGESSCEHVHSKERTKCQRYDEIRELCFIF